MICPNCGNRAPKDADFCNVCGIPLRKKEKSKYNIALICFTIVFVVTIVSVAGAIIFLNRDKHPARSRMTTETETSVLTETETTTTAAPTSTTAATTTETTTTTTTTTEAPTAEWETAPIDRLYRPNKSVFIDQYSAYVYCTELKDQHYVKMRYGPSKSRFNTVGITVPNNESVIVQTESLNGWTLCFYNGTEGWIRSDFLFRNQSDLPNETLPEQACAGGYTVAVNDQYKGEPLNVRSQPTADSELLASLPNGTWVYIPEDTPILDGWVRVQYPTDDYDYDSVSYGYVLYKYLEQDYDVGDKPVLYLYPEKTQQVQVKINLKPSVRFGCTYPAYQNGWTVIAAPDGTLTNLADGRTYSYLFWDLVGKADYNFDSGFVVKGEDTAAFLQKTLDAIGLTPREANEFIVYWLPKMQNNPYNLISFQTTAYTDLVALDITPKPDSVLRVFMAYQKLDAPVTVPQQQLTPFVRKGFTAVEWGGAEVQ